ncbi:MAG TPA: DUF1028 domain-containing protein [Solirubrobacteraceae bacterium]|nr:DUF1028 domain-containing protein [Solirubrobacteraceae bacterium]
MTYSVVARDPQTGELGVAVQSHWFSVGGVVPHVRPGVGAVALQAVPDVAHGARILDRLGDGATPDEALAAVLRDDEGETMRQTAVVDASGRVAVHTGSACIAEAAHVAGDGWSCQANMMARDTVWDAMARALDAAGAEPLAERLVAALEAAEAEGGDLRGRQSAALVAGAIELRVEDHPDPVAELRRLLVLHRAYEAAEEGDSAVAAGRFDAAATAYERASALAPDNHELLFWAGLAAAQGGDMDLAVERVRRAIAIQPSWRELLARLGPEHAPSAAAVRRALARD